MPMTSSFLCWVSKLLETAYFQIDAASSSFMQSYSNFAQTFNTSITLEE